MASQGKWETVGGGKRSKTSSERSDGKNKSEPAMATMETKDPLAPSQTLFEGFNRRSPAAQKLNGHTGSDPGSPHAGKKASKPAKKPSKPELVHPMDVLKKLSGNELKSLIVIHREKHDDDMIRLRLLSTFLQEQFANCDPLDSDPGLTQQPKGFPLLSASKDVQNALSANMAQLSGSMRVMYYKTCVDKLLHQAKTGSQIFGWRMLVQAICIAQPTVVISSIDNLEPLVRPCANQPRHCLPLLWCFEQVPIDGPQIGSFTTWHRGYSPILSERNIAAKVQAHTISRLKALIASADKNPGTSSRVPYQMVLDFLQLSLGQAGDPPPTVLQEVQAQYDNVLRLFFAHTLPADVVKMFESLLLILRPQLIQSCPEMLNQVYSLLVTCLHMNTSCYRSWLQLHRKNIQQSSYFVKRLNTSYTENHEFLSERPLDLDSMVDVLQRLDGLHAAMVNQSSVTQHMRLESSRNCKALLQTLTAKQAEAALRKSSRGCRWIVSLLFWSVLAVLLAIVAADVHQSKSWTASKTRLYLDQWGVLDVCKRASSEVWNAFQQAMRWLQRTTPPLVAHWSRDAEPYFMRVVQVYQEAYSGIAGIVAQAVAWLASQYANLTAAEG